MRLGGGVIGIVVVVVVVVATALIIPVARGQADFAAGKRVVAEVLVTEFFALTAPEHRFLECVLLMLQSEPEVAIVFEACLVLIGVDELHHVGVIHKQVEIVGGVEMEVGLCEHAPRGRPSMERIYPSFLISVVLVT